MNRFDFQNRGRNFDLVIFPSYTIERSYTSNAVRIVVNDMIGRINLREALKTKENVEEQEDTKQDNMVEVDKVESDKSENDWMKLIDAEDCRQD